MENENDVIFLNDKEGQMRTSRHIRVNIRAIYSQMPAISSNVISKTEFIPPKKEMKWTTTLVNPPEHHHTGQMHPLVAASSKWMT